MFNIRNYSPEVINIQRRQTELNIILLRVNNFNIKQKKGMEYLFYYMLPTPNKIWQDKGQGHGLMISGKNINKNNVK